MYIFFRFTSSQMEWIRLTLLFISLYIAFSVLEQKIIWPPFQTAVWTKTPRSSLSLCKYMRFEYVLHSPSR